MYTLSHAFFPLFSQLLFLVTEMVIHDVIQLPKYLGARKFTAHHRWQGQVMGLSHRVFDTN